MKTEFEVKNTMISMIESLKNSFDDSDMEYMKRDDI